MQLIHTDTGSVAVRHAEHTINGTTGVVERTYEISAQMVAGVAPVPTLTPDTPILAVTVPTANGPVHLVFDDPAHVQTVRDLLDVLGPVLDDMPV